MDGYIRQAIAPVAATTTPSHRTPSSLSPSLPPPLRLRNSSSTLDTRDVATLLLDDQRDVFGTVDMVMIPSAATTISSPASATTSEAYDVPRCVSNGICVANDAFRHDEVDIATTAAIATTAIATTVGDRDAYLSDARRIIPERTMRYSNGNMVIRATVRPRNS